MKMRAQHPAKLVTRQEVGLDNGALFLFPRFSMLYKEKANEPAQHMKQVVA